MMVKESVEEFIQELASGMPTPGGGSAAALGGAMAASLAEMVCNLTIGKEKYEDVQEEVKSEKEKLALCRERLVEIVDEDAGAFDRVMEAFRMPKGNEEEKERRAAAIQEAFKLAASVPMETAEKCMEVLEHAVVVAGIGNKNSITDAGSSALLAHASLNAALLNVRINLSGIKDEGFVEKMTARVKELQGRADEKLAYAKEIVEEGL